MNPYIFLLLPTNSDPAESAVGEARRGQDFYLLSLLIFIMGRGLKDKQRFISPCVRVCSYGIAEIYVNKLMFT